MKKKIFLIAGLFILLVAEILRVYFIMPFPGSQQSDTIGIAYFLHRNIWWIRIAGIALAAKPAIHFFREGKLWQKIALGGLVVFYAVIFFAFNFKFMADTMFYQPKEKLFKSAPADTTDKNKLIIGVFLNGEAKAYPVEIIGYHHQVKDTVGKLPLMVTYCTVCRTGRVYSPFVKGKYETFRLVGMDHFNAMFEDAATKSWWQQATGTAITGSLKGEKLREIPSTQMKLGDWISLYPNTFILQKDKHFKAEYDSLKGYDEGTLSSSLEARDSSSWQKKSWIVGIKINEKSKAYDWNNLVEKKVIQDQFQGTSILITTEPGAKSFYTLNRYIENLTLNFTYDATTGLLKDAETFSTWKPNGTCVEGLLAGKRLAAIQSYQEFWHSWKYFHPDTEKNLSK